jgi:hypothetical protein
MKILFLFITFPKKELFFDLPWGPNLVWGPFCPVGLKRHIACMEETKILTTF